MISDVTTVIYLVFDLSDILEQKFLLETCPPHYHVT